MSEAEIVLGYVSPSKDILITPDKLQARITEVGRQIETDYAGKELVLVCILKGGVLFLTDLMRAIHIPHAIDFMAVSSCEVLHARGPASLKICTLLDKYERREAEVKLDYVGFRIPNEFVYGYGLDLDELYRNLPFIGVVRD